MSIFVICAWCHAHIETKEGDAPCPISHGICPDCAAKVRREMDEKIKPQDERRIYP